MLNSWHSHSNKALRLYRSSTAVLRVPTVSKLYPACPYGYLLMGIDLIDLPFFFFRPPLELGCLSRAVLVGASHVIGICLRCCKHTRVQSCASQELLDEKRTVEKESSLFPVTENNRKEAGGKRKLDEGKRKAGGTQEKATACDAMRWTLPLPWPWDPLHLAEHLCRGMPELR